MPGDVSGADQGREGQEGRPAVEPPSGTRRVAALFDAVSGTYDQVGVDFFGPIAAGLVRAVAPRPGERALDLGCGRGAALVPLARALGATGRATGADLSAGMLRQCRQVLDAEGLAQVELVEADAQGPDPAVLAPDGGLDLVVSSLVLFFLPDPPAALRQWLRLLRPGGRLGVSTFGAADPAWQHVDAVFRPYLPPEMLDARTTGASGPFGSDEGVERLLSDAGAVDVRTTHLDLDVRFADVHQWYRFSMSHGQRAMWMAVPPDEREAVLQEVLARAGEAVQPDGSLTLHQDVRYTVAHRPA